MLFLTYATIQTQFRAPSNLRRTPSSISRPSSQSSYQPAMSSICGVFEFGVWLSEASTAIGSEVRFGNSRSFRVAQRAIGNLNRRSYLVLFSTAQDVQRVWPQPGQLSIESVIPDELHWHWGMSAIWHSSIDDGTHADPKPDYNPLRLGFRLWLRLYIHP